MKKLLLLSIILVSNFTFAGEWTAVDYKGDELLGTTDHTEYTYSDGMGQSFTYFSNNQYDFVIYVENGIFNAESQSYGWNCKSLVGFYDKEGTLVEKADIYLITYDNLHTLYMSKPYSRIYRDVAVKVHDYITNCKGYVRIVVQLYQNGNYDLTIPCNK